MSTAMDLKELLELTREMASDVAEPQLWSDKFIINALNDAEMEACRRSRLIVDSSTEKCCRIDLAAATSLYKVHDSVIFIRRVELSTKTDPLGFARFRDLDMSCPGWRTETGEVDAWVTDFETGKLRFFRTPTADQLPAHAMLTVVRGPLKRMSNKNDRPEIKPRFHYNLHHWALFRMYSKNDSQTLDPEAAAKHAGIFASEFGPPSSAIEEDWIDKNFDYSEEIGLF